MTTLVSNPTRVCECGHTKQRHAGGRGTCGASTAGYHYPSCVCSAFRVRTPQFQRLKVLEDTLLVTEEFLIDSPDGGWRLPPREDREGLIKQIRNALAFFPKE